MFNLFINTITSTPVLISLVLLSTLFIFFHPLTQNLLFQLKHLTLELWSKLTLDPSLSTLPEPENPDTLLPPPSENRNYE